jgi:transposase
VDVLKRIYRWLRPSGLLLDLHPEPEQPSVDIVLGEGGKVHLGRIDNTALIANIRAARAALASAVEQNLFEQERSLVFDFISHFVSVDEWLRQRQERRATSVVDPAMIDRAREPYLTDLTDAEFACLVPLLPAAHVVGRPRLLPIREILNAIFYVVRSGCAWRLLPHELPPWQTAFTFSACGVLTAPGSTSTQSCANSSARISGAILSRVRASSTANPFGRPASAA